MKVLRLVAARCEELTAGALLVLMSAATFGNVVARYFFNHPLEWAEEFSRYSFIWIVFLGAAYCAKTNQHIVINGLLLAVSARLRAVLELVAELITLGLMGVLLFYGWRLAVFTTQPTSTLHVPMSVVYVVVPISAALIGLRSIGRLAGRIRALAQGGGEGA